MMKEALIINLRAEVGDGSFRLFDHVTWYQVYYTVSH